MDISDRPVFYLKHFLRFQVEPTQMGPTDRVDSAWRRIENPVHEMCFK
jgi:hypothetical protein